jgi:hypothetical protein
LPRGVNDVVLHDVRVADARATLRFKRTHDDGRCHVDVVERHGTMHIVHAPPPTPAHPPSTLERIENAIVAHAPGRRARMLRLALGLEVTA